MDEVASANLEKPLLLRNQETQLISVNFDPKVVLTTKIYYKNDAVHS